MSHPCSATASISSLCPPPARAPSPESRLTTHDVRRARRRTYHRHTSEPEGGARNAAPSRRSSRWPLSRTYDLGRKLNINQRGLGQPCATGVPTAPTPRLQLGSRGSRVGTGGAPETSCLGHGLRNRQRDGIGAGCSGTRCVLVYGRGDRYGVQCTRTPRRRRRARSPGATVCRVLRMRASWPSSPCWPVALLDVSCSTHSM